MGLCLDMSDSGIRKQIERTHSIRPAQVRYNKVSKPLWWAEEALITRANKLSLTYCHFTVPDLPPTLNHYMKAGRTPAKTVFNEQTKKFEVQQGKYVPYLKDSVKNWRDMVCVYMGPLRLTFKPKSTIILLAEFHSPDWVSKKNEIRESDLDNRFKAMQDGVKVALQPFFDDRQVFEILARKVCSTHRRTRIILVDAGDVVDFDLS